MDFGFAPGTTPWEGFLRDMLKARNNTTLIDKRGKRTVADFLGELVAEAVSAEDLVPGSHASDEGAVFLALDSSTGVPVDYEALETVKTNGTINIPAAIRSATTSVHFKGCRLGNDDALPYLQLLKEALDNPTSVTAPKFFHGLYELSGGPSAGAVFEYMAYPYTVMNITPYPDTASLVAAFVAEGFTEQLDGTPVPDDNFKTWVKSSLKLKPARAHKVQFNFPVAITPATGGRNALSNLKAECRSRAETYPYTLSWTGPIPPAKADQLALVKTAVTAEPTMQSTHAYPMYQRMHFPDFDSFWDGMSWQVSVKGSNIIAIGTHYVYTLVIPILVPGTSATTQELLFNFYPTSGTPVMNFEEDNATYDMFGVV